MKKQLSSNTTQIIIIIIAFLFSAFVVGDSKSEYLLPRAAYSIVSSDIDLDGDIDIITGHNYDPNTEWSGIYLLNNSAGNYTVYDSIFIYGGQKNVMVAHINNDEYPDLIGQFGDDPYNIITILLYDNGSYTSNYYLMGEKVSFYTIGDVNGNSFPDVTFISNNDFLWGVIYNDGTGNFSAPQYFDLDFPPVDINCADLDGDGKSEVVVCGTHTEIYSWTESGFEQLVLTTTTSHDVLFADFDNDGDQDIITHRTLINPTHRVFFFENLGNNQFYERPYFDFSPFCSYAQIADFNNDSLPDIVFIASDDSGLYIYRNKGDFQLEFDQFISIENTSPRGLDCNDFDNNGYNDIAISYGIGNLNHFLKILFNNGEGSFLDEPVMVKEELTKPNNTFICYPNPFSNQISIETILSEKQKLQITIFDITGKQIKTIINKIESPGNYRFKWNGTDKNEKEVKDGLYFIKLKVSDQTIIKKVIKE
jgi:hypothetical protein